MGQFEIACIVLLGFAQLCVMAGYDTQSFLLESVIHSVHSRDPSRIDPYGGYYGQALLYFVYTFANFISPVILNYCGAKWTLVLGSTCFTLYQIGFFYINTYYFYISQAVVGLGYALFYSGQSAYITGHSTRSSISRNSAIVWAIGSCCMLAGSIVLFTIYSLSSSPTQSAMERVTDDVSEAFNDTLTGEAFDHNYRDYSDTDIRLIFGAFATISLCSNILFALLPDREVKKSLNSQQTKRIYTGVSEQLADMFTALRHPHMITLAPFFLFWGTFTTYWLGALPTTLVFTKSLASHIYLVPIYALSIASGEVIIGVVVSVFARRWSSFGMKPTLGIGCAALAAVFAISLAAVPSESTQRPTDQPAWLLQPSVCLSILLGVLNGIADGCMSTARQVVVALAVPHMRAQCYSISKFHQSLASAITFFLTPLLSVRLYCLIMAVQLVIAVLCFVKVANATKAMERVSTVANMKIHPEDETSKYARFDDSETIQKF